MSGNQVPLIGLLFQYLLLKGQRNTLYNNRDVKVNKLANL